MFSLLEDHDIIPRGTSYLLCTMCSPSCLIVWRWSSSTISVPYSELLLPMLLRGGGVAGSESESEFSESLPRRLAAGVDNWHCPVCMNSCEKYVNVEVGCDISVKENLCICIKFNYLQYFSGIFSSKLCQYIICNMHVIFKVISQSVSKSRFPFHIIS